MPSIDVKPVDEKPVEKPGHRLGQKAKLDPEFRMAMVVERRAVRAARLEAAIALEESMAVAESSEPSARHTVLPPNVP